MNKENATSIYNKALIWLIEYWPCLLFLLAIIGFTSKALYNYPVAVMALLGLYKVIKKPHFIINDKAIRLFIMAYLCLWLPMVLSLIDAVNFSHSSQTVFPYLRFLFAGIFIIDEITKNQKRLNFIVDSIFFIVLFWCIDATLQFMIGKNLLGYPYQPGRITGMFYPRNTISHICAILSSLFFLYIYINLNKNKWLIIGILPLFFIMLLSGRRAAWLMLALSSFGFSVYVYAYSKNKKIVIKSIAVIATIVILILGTTVLLHEPTNNRLKITMGLFSTDYSSMNRATAIRLPIWETAYNIFKTNYINGIGPRGFRHAYQNYSKKDNYYFEKGQTQPHLLILEILTETGLIGFIGYVLLIYYLSRITLGFSFKKPLYPFLIPAFISLFPFNAHMAFYGSIWSTIIWINIILFFTQYGLSIKNRD